jgi:predicted SprT family Zn-dependent metalloprotease
MRVGELLSVVAKEAGGQPVSDALVQVKCGKCGTKQTLAEAKVNLSPGGSTYQCHKCGGEIASVKNSSDLHAPYGLAVIVQPPAK